jgi:short-subunit dehydrogenase
MTTDQAAPRHTALVTGASAGIGEELARLLARDGYDLVLVARGADRLQALADQLGREHRVNARAVAADLSSGSAVEAVMGLLRSQRLDVEVLVNNAGYGVYGPFAEGDVEAELGMIHLNVTALTHLTRLLLPGMIARRSGRILNVASTAAFQPGPLMAVYYASKAYVLSFSEALTNELLGTGVTVTCLCPGPTRTEFQARARMEGVRLISDRHLMAAAPVARAGYEGMLRGKTLVIPGMRNRVLAQAVRFTPRKLVTRITRRLQERPAR